MTSHIIASRFFYRVAHCERLQISILYCSCKTTVTWLLWIPVNSD